MLSRILQMTKARSSVRSTSALPAQTISPLAITTEMRSVTVAPLSTLQTTTTTTRLSLTGFLSQTYSASGKANAFRQTPPKKGFTSTQNSSPLIKGLQYSRSNEMDFDHAILDHHWFDEVIRFTTQQCLELIRKHHLTLEDEVQKAALREMDKPDDFIGPNTYVKNQNYAPLGQIFTILAKAHVSLPQRLIDSLLGIESYLTCYSFPSGNILHKNTLLLLRAKAHPDLMAYHKSVVSKKGSELFYLNFEMAEMMEEANLELDEKTMSSLKENTSGDGSHLKAKLFLHRLDLFAREDKNQIKFRRNFVNALNKLQSFFSDLDNVSFLTSFDHKVAEAVNRLHAKIKLIPAWHILPDRGKSIIPAVPAATWDEVEERANLFLSKGNLKEYLLNRQKKGLKLSLPWNEIEDRLELEEQAHKKAESKEGINVLTQVYLTTYEIIKSPQNASLTLPPDDLATCMKLAETVYKKEGFTEQTHWDNLYLSVQSFLEQLKTEQNLEHTEDQDFAPRMSRR